MYSGAILQLSRFERIVPGSTIHHDSNTEREGTFATEDSFQCDNDISGIDENRLDRMLFEFYNSTKRKCSYEETTIKAWHTASDLSLLAVDALELNIAETQLVLHLHSRDLGYMTYKIRVAFGGMRPG